MKQQTTSPARAGKSEARDPKAGGPQAGEPETSLASLGALRKRAEGRLDRASLRPGHIIQLQRTIGNRAVRSMLASAPSGPARSPALTVGPAGGALELEADRAADIAMQRLARPPEGPPSSGAGPNHAPTRATSTTSTLSTTPRGAPLVQRKSTCDGDGVDAPPGVAEGIERARGRGQRLGDSVRSSMEGAFGADFSGVRVHTDARANELNQSLAARAFTSGHDVFFSAGSFSPSTQSGQRLLAHELSHVVQQGPSGRAIQRFAVGELPVKNGYGKILNHPDWEKEAIAYEKRLGVYCANHPNALAAADKALSRMKNVLAAYFKPQNKTDADIAEAFLQNDATSAGQVGTKDPEQKLKAIFEQGNLREKMTAFYNAAYFKAGYAKDPGVSLKGILHDVTMKNGAFDKKTSDNLGLDSEGLEEQSDFLLGKPRKRLKGAVKKVAKDKKYTFDKDIFALGNLYYQHSNDALEEMVKSQKPRVARSPLEHSIGQQKMTPRDFKQLGVPLSKAEKGLLENKPMLISQVVIEPSEMVGEHKDPIMGDTLTISKDGQPHWNGASGATEKAEGLDKTGKLKKLVYSIDDEAMGTRQELEIIYAIKELDPIVNEDGTKTTPREAALNQDGSQKIAKINWNHIILNPAMGFLDDGVQGPELPVQWVGGGAWFAFKEQRGFMEHWYDEIHEQLRMPVVAGVSGTTTRMLLALKWLNATDVDMLHFRMAVMGWMLSCWDHSLYEILQGSRYAGVEAKGEKLDAVTEMYQTVAPFSKEQLRAHVCKDRLFPHEYLYMKMAKEKDDPSAELPQDPAQMGAFVKAQYGARLLEPGSVAIREATKTHAGLQVLSGNDKGRVYENMLTEDDLDDVEDDLEDAKAKAEDYKDLSVAHVTAIRGYTSGYHHYMNDVLSLPKAMAVRNIKNKLERHFRKEYLTAELDALDNLIATDSATDAQKRRRTAVNAKLQKIRIPASEKEWIATYNLGAARTLASQIAAAAPGSEARRTKQRLLFELIDKVALELYDELTTQANMTAEGLRDLKPAKGKVWRGDWKVGGRPRVFLKGSNVEFDSMASASRDQAMAIGFAFNYSSPVVMEIDLKGKGGRDITVLSSQQDEKEVLLMPGTRIHVDSVTETTGKSKQGDEGPYKLAKCTEV